MATSGTYYLNAPSLSSATSAYTDAGLTTLAPDGWYSDGSTVRELVSGVFTNIISSCFPCAAPCSISPVGIAQDRAILLMSQDLGSTSLDIGAVIVEIEYVGSETPVGVLVEFNGVSYNSFSCQAFGLVQVPAGPYPNFIYIGDIADDCGILAAGTQSLPIFEFNAVTSVFDNTGAYAATAPLAPQIQLSAGVPGKYVMVIPKTAASPSLLDFQSRLFCTGNDFNVTIKCPTNLPSFTSTENCATQIDTCALGTNQVYYSADVNGTTAAAGFFGLFDWVFFDSFGQTVLPDGWYRSPSVPAPDTSFEVADGVIIGFGACASATGWNIDYEVQNTISGSCAVNVLVLEFRISQPPIPAFVDTIAPDTGLVSVVAGLTHVQMVMSWIETYTPCGQVKMVIEKDGLIIASKTFTPVTGTDYYLDVDFDLVADASIYGYITLA